MDRPERLLDPTSEPPRWLPLLAWGVVVLSAFAVIFGNLRFGKAVLSVGLEDDFFYYAQVARNLAFHGVSSFDGTHLTNGYHPLWLLILTVLTKFFDVGGLLGAKSVYPVAIGLEIVQVAIILAIALAAYRVAKLFCSVATSYAIQLLAVAGALMIVRGGMEAGLTMALALAMLWYRLRPEFDWTARCTFRYGMLASLVVLARIDTVLLIGMLFLFDVLPQGQSGRQRLRILGWFLLGLWPLAIYAVVNYAVFGAVMPISGTAKALRDVYIPSVPAMISFAGRLFNPKLPVYAICFVLTIAAPVMLLLKRRSSPNGCIGIFWAVLLFPLVHLLAVVTRSDWMIWPWYVYAWPIAAVIASIVLLRPAKLATPCFWAALALLAFTAAYLVHASRVEDELTYLAGEDIAAFAATHPGIYAMGDRAGAPAYLSNQPFVQLEGLMMEPEFLDNIRVEKNLKDVLQTYKVRYYISTGDTRDASGCYSVQEPAQAGPDSPTMRSLICQAPIATFEHRGFVNHVFDMQ